MLTFWQKFQSHFSPVSVRKGSTAHNAQLELFYYRGRYVLATADAVYSDGHKYRPLVTAFTSSVLKPRLAHISDVLVLGAGLASAVHILDSMGHHPHYTLVDIDETVLQWAADFLPPDAAQRVHLVHADARRLIDYDDGHYDLIVVDIFIGREVPEWVTGKQFLECCKLRLAQKGCVIVNYMLRSEASPAAAKAALEAVFGLVTEISFGINKVYIAVSG